MIDTIKSLLASQFRKPRKNCVRRQDFLGATFHGRSCMFITFVTFNTTRLS